MGNFGGFYKGDSKKKKKKDLERKARELVSKETFRVPEIEIIKKGKK